MTTRFGNNPVDKYYYGSSEVDKLYYGNTLVYQKPFLTFESSFNLHSDNNNARGIALSSSRIYIVDNNPDKIFVYDHQGNRQSSEEFNLHSDNTTPLDVKLLGNFLYVLEEGTPSTDDEFFTYHITDVNQRGLSSDLHSNTGGIRNIAYRNNTLEWYAYNNTTKVLADLGSNGLSYTSVYSTDLNLVCEGLVTNNNLLYIAHSAPFTSFPGPTIYAYSYIDPSGPKHPENSFNLDSGDRPTGMDFYDNKLWICDRTSDTVKVYSL